MKNTGYSATQIMLHWTVAILIAFQFFLNDGISEAWRVIMNAEQLSEAAIGAANIHATMGLLILMLALWRIVLRLTFGALPQPQNEPRVLRQLSRATHVLLYALLLLVPLSGAVAWFGGIAAAGTAHNLFKLLLLLVVAVHIAGALVQHFIFRSDVLMRMLINRD